MLLHRSFVHAGLWVALGLGLAAPVALADPAQCEARYGTASSAEMQACLQHCPEARDPTKASTFQACALRCKSKFDDSFKSCRENCPGLEDGKGKKKKKGGS